MNSKSTFRHYIAGIIFIIMPATVFAQNDTLPPIATSYQWISYRGKANVTDTGGSRTCNFYIVNRRDSIIYLNVNLSGVEILRAVFTPDGFTYVNKLNYNYYQGNYAPLRFLTSIPLSFDLLEAAINGDTNVLPKYQKLTFNYQDYEAIDSTRSFFKTFIFNDLDHVIKIEGHIKAIHFDTPGPTGIKIPEKFTEIKF